MSEYAIPEGVPEGVKLGGSWDCEDGCHHFLCAGCVRVFTADPSQTETDRILDAIEDLGFMPEEDEKISMCDECYKRAMELARKEGLLP